MSDREHRAGYEEYGEYERGRAKRQKRGGFLGSRAFLAAVTVAIYATAVVMLFVFSKDLGINIKAEKEATVAQNVLGSPVYPDDYTMVRKTSEEIHDGFLTLINNENACLRDGVELVNLSESYNETYKISDLVMQANRTTVEHMNNMFSDFKKAVGDNDVIISCAYRSMALQGELYDEEVEEKGEEEGAKWVNKPGYSEHQSGYSFDLSLIDDEGGITEFDGEGIYGWIEKNCEKYGFIIRYPSDKTEITGIYHEPWHIRYVGEVHAGYMKEYDLCMEEYIELIKGYRVEDPLEYRDVDMNDWQIYFVPASKSGDVTEVPIPKDRQYEISGNNIDGFIVTVKMNT